MRPRALEKRNITAGFSNIGIAPNYSRRTACICSANKEKGKFDQMGLVWFASFSTYDLGALNQIIILQESAALLVRSRKDTNLPSGKFEFAARQIRICRPANWSIWNDLLNWNLPFSLLAEQMRAANMTCEHACSQPMQSIRTTNQNRVGLSWQAPRA